MSRFDEELTETLTNNSILEDEFNLDSPTEDNQSIEKIKEMREDLLETISKNQPDPDDILYVNIQRANDLLDVVYRDIMKGSDISPRVIEVAAQLVNAVTTAATSVQNSGFGMMKHEYNMKIADIKEREVAVKAAMVSNKPQGSGSSTGGKVVVMSREELLNMIEIENKEVEIPSVDEENN